MYTHTHTHTHTQSSQAALAVCVGSGRMPYAHKWQGSVLETVIRCWTPINMVHVCMLVRTSLRKKAYHFPHIPGNGTGRLTSNITFKKLAVLSSEVLKNYVLTQSYTHQPIQKQNYKSALSPNTSLEQKVQSQISP